MKSDREFLDGIYKKAQEHQKNEEKELISKDKAFYHRGYKTLRPVLVTGMAVVLICSGIFAYDLGMFPFQTKTSDINIDRYSDTPNAINYEMVRGVEPMQSEDASLPKEIEARMKEGTVIRGRVAVLLESESQGEMEVEINKVYSGEEKIGSVVKVKFENNLISANSYNQLTGVEDVLLYLDVDENNEYILADEKYGIFSYYEQVDGFDIFIGDDFVLLNTKIFTENVK